ncbi:Hypothetical protein HDN1F_31830 [gamma proteobacterium HdN1]|nr:Hypothetical protein HDN1F_31830 [gamma proteobacterium HdN1]
MNATNEQPESMAGMLVTELLEYAVNLALHRDEAAVRRLVHQAGKVVRIKTVEPHSVFYLSVTETGVALSTHHEDIVHARVRLPTTLLARLLVGGEGLGGEGLFSEVRVAGDEKLLQELLAIAVEFNLWSVVKRSVQQWLPEFQSIEDLLRLLRDQDPAWLARLEHLPQMTHEAILAVKDLRAMQMEQLEALREMRLQMERDRRKVQVSTVLGLIMVVVAFLSHNGYLDWQPVLAWGQIGVLRQPLAFNELLMLIVALVILVPRLAGRR